MRTAFADTIFEIAAENPDVYLLTGDLGFSVLEKFAAAFPDRYINVGVAEQNMIGVAAGLALSGKTVFVYSIANFPTLRCLEQIRNDVCYHNANVKIVAVGGGFTYATLGPTHYGLEDLAIMRALPNMTVIAPGDPAEARAATRAAAALPSPCYLRLGRAGEPNVHTTPPAFELGRALEARQGGDATIITTGGMLYNAVTAADQLREQGIACRVLSLHTLKPLDRDAVMAAAGKPIITVEEHSAIGGLGSAVAEVLAELRGVPVWLERIAVPSEFAQFVGSQSYFHDHYGLSAAQIARRVVDTLRAYHGR